MDDEASLGRFVCILGCLSRCPSLTVGRPASAFTENVSRTIGFTSFSKIKLLWLQCGGAPPTVLQPQAFFSLFENVEKPMVWQHFDRRNDDIYAEIFVVAHIFSSRIAAQRWVYIAADTCLERCNFERASRHVCDIGDHTTAQS